MTLSSREDTAVKKCDGHTGLGKQRGEKDELGLDLRQPLNVF